jgi:hypothetical protein
MLSPLNTNLKPACWIKGKKALIISRNQKHNYLLSPGVPFPLIPPYLLSPCLSRPLHFPHIGRVAAAMPCLDLRRQPMHASVSRSISVWPTSFGVRLRPPSGSYVQHREEAEYGGPARIQHRVPPSSHRIASTPNLQRGGSLSYPVSLRTA